VPSWNFKLLNKIYAQTERLKNIIESFRKFAKGDRQHREKVNLNQVRARIYRKIIYAIREH
jgi:nitrogen fixation/metabolism regulation signal transduction histidine kinase